MSEIRIGEEAMAQAMRQFIRNMHAMLGLEEMIRDAEVGYDIQVGHIEGSSPPITTVTIIGGQKPTIATLTFERANVFVHLYADLLFRLCSERLLEH